MKMVEASGKDLAEAIENGIRELRVRKEEVDYEVLAQDTEQTTVRVTVKEPREHLQEAITWLRLIEDQAGLSEAQAWLQALKEGTLEALNPPAEMGWVKDHVALAEGKVYCEFESPMAHR